MSLISVIAAMSEDRVIGKDNRLPWNIKSDLANFKKITLGKPVIMGRKTFESLRAPLPGRENIIITRDPFFTAEGIKVFRSIEDGLNFARDIPADEIMVIGGEQIFEATLDTANRMYLTVIRQIVVNGDAFFPEYDTAQWQQIETKDLEENVTFTVYDKIKAA